MTKPHARAPQHHHARYARTEPGSNHDATHRACPLKGRKGKRKEKTQPTIHLTLTPWTKPPFPHPVLPGITEIVFNALNTLNVRRAETLPRFTNSVIYLQNQIKVTNSCYLHTDTITNVVVQQKHFLMFKIFKAQVAERVLRIIKNMVVYSYK
jgi:hypothetical protein